MGKELDDLSFKELQQLEDQLSDGVLSVKNKKVLHCIIFFAMPFFFFL